MQWFAVNRISALPVVSCGSHAVITGGEIAKFGNRMGKILLKGGALRKWYQYEVLAFKYWPPSVIARSGSNFWFSPPKLPILVLQSQDTLHGRFEGTYLELMPLPGHIALEKNFSRPIPGSGFWPYPNWHPGYAEALRDHWMPPVMAATV